MPFFKTVGYIEDEAPPDVVMREYRRRYSLEAYHRRRAELLTELGGRCSRCATTTDLVMVRKPKTPKFTPGALVTLSAAKRQKFLGHVILLCGEHASQRLYRKGQLTHGTYWAAYKKKCRCDECGEYMADYNLRRRENRRAAKPVTHAP